MSGFDTLCKVLEDMDTESYNDAINRTSARVITGLMDITEDGESAIGIYIDFIMCAVAADGRLTREEYLMLKPSLDLLLNKDTTYGDAQKIFYDSGLDNPGDYKIVMDKMIDILGKVDPTLKDDIILLCLMVCAVDGNVADEEKAWIRQLAE